MADTRAREDILNEVLDIVVVGARVCEKTIR
jgi:hypothetical protein